MKLSVFESASRHEQVVYCRDPRSGLRAIIALYSTALGPALGGTRFHPYADEDEALADVLRLSEAMAYKSALAGLDLGGGKAVIIGDPALEKSESLLRAYGCFVAGLCGRYITACDVGNVANLFLPRPVTTGRGFLKSQRCGCGCLAFAALAWLVCLASKVVALRLGGHALKLGGLGFAPTPCLAHMFCNFLAASLPRR